MVCYCIDYQCVAKRFAEKFEAQKFGFGGFCCYLCINETN